MANNKDELKLWNRNFILIMLSNFLVAHSFQILIPTLPLYVSYIGLPEVFIGLIIGSLTITTIILRPFAGQAVDRWNRKNLFVVGMLVIATSIFSYQFTSSLYGLILLRLCHGIGWGIVTTASRTIAVDFIPHKKLGEGMGYYGISTVLSTAIAPALGVYIFNLWGYKSVFYSATFLTLIGAILGYFIRYSKVSVKVQGEISFSTNLFEKSVLKISVINFFVSISFSSIMTYIVLYALELNVQNIGLFFIVFSLTLVVTRPLSGKLIDKKGFTYLITPSILSLAIGIGLLYLASSLMILLLGAIVIGLGIGTIQPSLQAMTVYNIPPRRRGVANSTFMLSSDLGFGIGVMLWGFVANVSSYKSMYLFVLIPITIAFFIHKIYISKRNKESTVVQK